MATEPGESPKPEPDPPRHPHPTTPKEAGPDRASLQADNELLGRLARAGFAGKEWDTFTAVLFDYGYQVVRAWICSGRMFTRCRCRLPRHGPISIDVADELAMDTLAEAIPGFRDEVLIPGKWDPEGGAALTTFFIGFCTLRFPNVYRQRYRSDERWTKAIAGADQQSRSDDRGRFADPANQVDLTARLLEAMSRLPTKTQEILILREIGYDNTEIAELTGLTVGAVESRVDRLSRRRRQK